MVTIKSKCLAWRCWILHLNVKTSKSQCKQRQSGSWGSQSSFVASQSNAVYFSCVVCSSSDQSGILHEIHKSGPQLKENAVQKTEWGVWSQNKRGDKVSMIYVSYWGQNWLLWYLTAQLPKKTWLCRFYTHSLLCTVRVHRRERSKVPYIVRQCIEEVEKRGIDEVGIYRISGVATDIQALKTAFDTSKTPLTLSFCLTLFSLNVLRGKLQWFSERFCC